MSLLNNALRGLRWRPRSPVQQRSPQDTGDLITPSGMLAGDLANEAVAGLFARPGRMSLTVLGTVIGLAALVAFNPLMVWFSQEARSYSLLVFLGALSFLQTLRVRDRPTAPSLLLWTLCGVLLVSVH